MNELINEISINNEWRDGEFAKFKINQSNVPPTLWFRMCVPMIYAHWEGFVVDALKTLLKHLNKMELDHAQLKTHLVVTSLGDSYNSLSGKQSFDQKITFTEKFYDLLNHKVKFKPQINTKSNLRFDVLEDICSKFGFNSTRFTHLKSDINRIVDIRNCIAHGENSIVPDVQNITRYIDSVKSAMDILLEEIDLFLTNKSYLQNAS